MISAPGQVTGQAWVLHPAGRRSRGLNGQRALARWQAGAFWTQDQPVTELHDSLHFTEEAGISVDIPPGTGEGAGYWGPSHPLPWAGVTLGRHQGHGISRTFKELTVPGGNAVSSASNTQDCVPLLPGPLGLNKSLALSGTVFSSVNLEN